MTRSGVAWSVPAPAEWAWERRYDKWDKASVSNAEAVSRLEPTMERQRIVRFEPAWMPGYG
ncbi:MAG: hypothetical protein JXO72_11310 [Vicinamibacteria bacterium]|nr:hypothetical protein [Vicinamibacteria bacterium]